MAVLKLATIIEPRWRTTARAQGGLKAQIPANHANFRPPVPPALRPEYRKVDYSLAATQPGADLVREAIHFRALYGMWTGPNVAVFRYSVTGPDGAVEERTVVAVSGASAHSEGRALQYLSALQAELREQGYSLRVTGVYTEREPCDGKDKGQFCAGLMATHPLMRATPPETGPPVYASFPYSVDSPGPEQDATAVAGEDAHAKAMKATAAATAPNLAAIEEEARRTDVTHVLPMSRYIPLTDTLPMVDGRLVMSAAFSSRDVANVPQSERFLPEDDPRRDNNE